MSYTYIISTFPDKESASAMANRLLELKYVACVQLSQIESYYRWKNNIANDVETKFVAKTRTEFIKRVEKELLSAHPYDLPQFITIPIANASEAYSQWIDEVVQSSD